MEKGFMHYLLLLVFSKENIVPSLPEEYLERDITCTIRSTMAQRSLNINIHSLVEGHHANPALELPCTGAHRLPSRDGLQTLQGWWKPLQLHRQQQSSIPCDLTSCL